MSTFQLTPLVAALRAMGTPTPRGQRPLISPGLLQPKPQIPLAVLYRCGTPFISLARSNTRG